MTRSHRPTRTRSLLLAAGVTLLGVTTAGPVGAHTESDVVAVPAGEDSALTFKPTHGCDGSPTVEVAVQAPVSGATAVDVEGWTATSTEDGEGNTVLEWTGGSLPADETGEFPISFRTPDTPGELLIFPAVQVCEDGTELSWIDGDPDGDYPAPRILVLPSSMIAASTIDEVPADAPGRDQLTEIVDVDNPTAPETTTSEPNDDAPTTTSAGSDTTAPNADPPADVTGDVADDEDDDSSPLVPILIGLAVVGVILGIAASVMAGRRRREDQPGAPPADRV